MICSNCYTEIKGDYVTSVDSTSHMHIGCASTCIECGVYITDEESVGNKFKCTKCHSNKLQELNIEHIRRSHIELYKTCPYAFYLEVIKKVDVENNVYALHGIILHDMFDFYSKQINICAEEMYSEFLLKFAEQVPHDHYNFKEKPDLYDALLKKGIVAIDGFIEYHKSALPVWVSEKQLFFSVSDSMPKVSITMDRIEKKDNQLRFVDYKCGKTFSGMKLSTDLQVPLYCLASKSEYGQLPIEFEFVFVSEGKRRLYILHGDNTYKCMVGKRTYEVNLTESIREVRNIFGNIQRNNFSIPPTVNEWHCNNMCYFGTRGICKGKVHQRWLGK